MSLSPWDLSGNITFDFSLYRPRRPSYVYATQISRSRNESYRNATKSDSSVDDEFDFIEAMRHSRRKNSYKQATDDFSEADTPVTASDGLPLPVGNHVPCYVTPRVDTIVEQSEPSWSQDQLDAYKPPLSRTPTVDSSRSFDATRSLDLSRSTRSLNCRPFERAKSLDVCEYHARSFEEETEPETSDVPESMSDCAFQSEPDPQLVIKLLHSKWRYRRNLFVLTLSFILVFTAFRSIQNLQSSINTAGKLGLISMGSVHGTMFLSCLFVPAVINKLTSKWTMVLGLVFYLTWIAANFYPHFYTLVPTSIGVGFGQGLAWGAQVTYMQKLAIDYAHISREFTKQELYKFNGIFLAFFQTTHIWGNLLSYFMLDSDVLYRVQMKLRGKVEKGTLGEDMMRQSTLCGVYDQCAEPDINVTDTGVVGAPYMIMKLMGAYLLFAGIGFLLVLLLLEKIGARSETETSCSQLLRVNVRQIVQHKTFRLMVPMLLFNGFEQGFIYADFNKSFVTCTIGVESVGLAMMTMGLTNSVFSLLVGLAARHVPREALVGMAAVLQMGLLIFLLVWIPDSRLSGVFYVIAALWGVCDAIWQTQCNCLVNLSCPEEHDIAFQNFRLLQGLGASLAFLSGAVVCVSVKLYFIMTLLVLAVLCYVCAEYRIRRRDQVTSEDCANCRQHPPGAEIQAPPHRPTENHVTIR